MVKPLKWHVCIVAIALLLATLSETRHRSRRRYLRRRRPLSSGNGAHHYRDPAFQFSGSGVFNRYPDRYRTSNYRRHHYTVDNYAMGTWQGGGRYSHASAPTSYYRFPPFGRPSFPRLRVPALNRHSIKEIVSQVYETVDNFHLPNFQFIEEQRPQRTYRRQYQYNRNRQPPHYSHSKTRYSSYPSTTPPSTYTTTTTLPPPIFGAVPSPFFNFPSTFYTIANGVLVDANNEPVGDGGFTIADDPPEVDSDVFNSAGAKVGIVQSVDEERGGAFRIIPTGVERQFSFGPDRYRINSRGRVENADGTQVAGAAGGTLTVVDRRVLLDAMHQVGITVPVGEQAIFARSASMCPQRVKATANEFYIISNGGLAFTFRVDENGTVFNRFDQILDGFTIRGGLLLDGNGNMRAFVRQFATTSPCTGLPSPYFSFTSEFYTIANGGVLVDASGNTPVGDGFTVTEANVTAGSNVLSREGLLVGKVVSVDEASGRLRIMPTGVQRRFSFGSGRYRINSNGRVEHADGRATMPAGAFSVADGTVRFDSLQIGTAVPSSTDDGEFYIISRGGLAFTFRIDDDGMVLGEFGRVLDGFVFRAADGAVIDNFGDIRAFREGTPSSPPTTTSTEATTTSTEQTTTETTMTEQSTTTEQSTMTTTEQSSDGTTTTEQTSTRPPFCAGVASTYFNFGSFVGGVRQIKFYTVVDGLLLDANNDTVGDGFTVRGGAVAGASVLNSAGAKVGRVYSADESGRLVIASMGVTRRFSFGPNRFRFDSDGRVENADGRHLLHGFIAVVDGQAIIRYNATSIDQVGLVVPSSVVDDEFYIIANGGLAFEFSIDVDGAVLDHNRQILEGYTFREVDGAVLDCNGNVRAFDERTPTTATTTEGTTTTQQTSSRPPFCAGVASTYFNFGSFVGGVRQLPFYTVVDGVLMDANNETVGDGFTVQGDAVAGASVLNSAGAKVGRVYSVDESGRIVIASMGVTRRFSFGPNRFRFDSDGRVENADGRQLYHGLVEVVDGQAFIRYSATSIEQVGLVVPSSVVDDEFYLIANGGLAFEFSIDVDAGTVLDHNGQILEGYTFREVDGAVLDCNGNVRALAS